MKDTLTLNQDAYLPLRDVVFNTLRDSILKGDLEPGERLMEIHLANKLGVSRTPVREAIRMLEQEGLAVTLPRRGAQVAKMTEKDLEDVLEIRDALEELAVTNACKNITKDDIVELRETVARFKSAADRGAVREMVDADEEFHDIIYRVSGNRRLTVIIQSLKEQIYRYRYEYIKDFDNYILLLQEHDEIIAGLEKGDREYVREIMRTHLKNQMEAVRSVIKKQEQN